MAINVYTVSLLVHIATVVVWMFTIPIMAIVGKAADAASTAADKFKILNLASVNGKISIISAVLIFLSGAMLIESGPWSWAPTANNFWLVTKQTIWIIILIGAIILLKPLNDKMQQEMEVGNEEEVESIFSKLKIRTHILTTFIVINILLGILKPF